MSTTANSIVFETLVRMVVPMRREFGVVMDVQRARHDSSYARDLIQRAKSSQHDRLRGYADFVQSQIDGPSADTETRAPAAAVHAPKFASRQAARLLLDAVGPQGEPLAMRLEEPNLPDERDRLLALAVDLVAQVRGAAFAQAWRSGVKSDR